MKEYSAAVWSEWGEKASRHFPRPGLNAEIQWRPHGIVISASADAVWRHPWQVQSSWETEDDEERKNTFSWVARFWPGFVNGRDVGITGKSGLSFLTDSEPEGLRLTAWRDPTASAGIDVEDGELVALAGEGFPKFFEELGVRGAARGGKLSAGGFEEPFDETRTRSIRAMDIILRTPRFIAAVDVTVDSGIGTAQTLNLTTKFINTAVLNAPTQYQLLARSKWVPQPEPTALDRLQGTEITPDGDELLIATIWAVSPPDWGGDDVDESWTLYPQYFVFWNLMHAAKQSLPTKPQGPLRLVTGLGAGTADLIFDALLTPVNDNYEAVNNYLFAADFRGDYWSI